MRKLLLTTALVGVAGGAYAQAIETLSSSSFGAGVSLLSDTPTGFNYSGAIEVTGVGTAAMTMSIGAATFDTTGFAGAGAVDANATANSGVAAASNFERTIEVSNALTGIGRSMARGNAEALTGLTGEAFGASSRETIAEAGTGDILGAITPTDVVITDEALLDTFVADPEGDFVALFDETRQTVSSSEAESESSAGLVGRAGSTLMSALVGSGSGFIGATGTELGASTFGASAGANEVIADGSTGLSIEDVTLATPSFAALSGEIEGLDPGAGVSTFQTTTTLLGDDQRVSLVAANVGQGTVSQSFDVAGFFGGGAATAGAGEFSTIDNVFDSQIFQFGTITP